MALMSGRAGRWPVIALLAVAVGAWLRLAGLDRQGLWLDEGWSMWFATQADLQGLRMENHPPLYYGLLALWARLVDGDAALRATGAMASFASMAVAARLAWVMTRSTRAAWVAAALMALASVDVMTARELRMYPWMTLAYGAALLAWRRAVPTTADGELAGVALAGAWLAGIVLAYLHAAGIFFAGAATVFALVLARRWRHRAIVALVGLATAAAYLPWVWWSVWQRLGAMDAGLAWRARPSLGQIVSTPLRWLVGADPLFGPSLAGPPCEHAMSSTVCHALALDGAWFTGARPALTVVAIGGLALAALGARPLVRRWGVPALAVAAAVFVPMALLLALTWFVAPWFDVKYLAPSMLAFACLIAMTVAAAPWPRAADALTAGLLGVMAVVGVGLPTTGTFQQWREAAARLQQRAAADEPVILNAIGPGAEWLLDRYFQRPAGAAPVVSLRQYVPDQYRSACERREGDCLARLSLPPQPPGATVWMIQTDLPLDKPGSFPFSARLGDWLARRLRVVEVMPFDGMTVLRMERIDAGEVAAPR